MSLLALIAALLLEQIFPLAARKNLPVWLSSYGDFFLRHFDAGQHKHGKIAWLIAMILPLCGTAMLYWLVASMSQVLAWAMNVLVLYLTMGFRQFSYRYTDIQSALRSNDLGKARSVLSSWRGTSCHELNTGEVVRLTIEEALLASHRCVFGVVVWFVIMLLLGFGPMGAVLYRLAQYLDSRWGVQSEAEFGEFGAFAKQAYHWIEWLPLRLTATSFAIAGNFEDTMYCWRTQAEDWPDPDAGIILASGAGALGIKLGLPVPEGGQLLDRPELGMGDEADIYFMQSAVGLVWRTLVFWMILLALLGMAMMVGSSQ